MASLTNCNSVILHLKDAKKNYRMEICRGYFEMIQNGAIVIDKLFKTICYFPESFSNHEIQAHVTNNSYMIFPSVHKCLCSLNQQSRNIVLVDNKRTYATEKTDSLAQILQNLSNNYGTIFEFEYDAVQNCLKEKIKSMKGVKDVISLRHKRKKINVLIPQRKMEGELKGKDYFPNLEIMFSISSHPIFRTNTQNPASLMEIVNSNIDPYHLTAEQSSLGEIVADCVEQESTDVRSTLRPQPTHHTRTRNDAVHNDTAQIRSHETISGREHFFSSSNNGRANAGSSVPDFAAIDHIRHPQYQAFAVRLSTFTKWPPSMTQRPEQVAQAGFYYTGLDDVVRCFACDGGFKNWDPEDDPWIEHARWFPQCPFVQKVKGQDFIDLVRRMTEESDEEEDCVVHSTFQRNNALANHSDLQHLSVGNDTGGAIAGSSVPDFGAIDHIARPQYQAFTVRLSTFTKWPPSMTQRPEQIAQAGFYYTGLDDVVRCFACDGGLKNWDPEDDPWIEHALWFPQCPFVQKVKGQDFIDLVKRMTEESDEEEDCVVHSTFQRNNALANHSDLQHLSVGNDADEPSQLDTDAAQAIIHLGYSRSAVAIAIDVLISKDRRDYTAYDIIDVILEKEDRGELLPTDSDPDLPRNPSQSFRSIPSVNEETQTILRENKSLKSIVPCIKCKTQARNILFLPCSHHCLCLICAEQCTLCPICYKIIKQKIKTFMI